MTTAPCAAIFKFNRPSTMELYERLVIRLLIALVCMIHGNHIVVQAQSTNFRYFNFSSPDNFSLVGDALYYEERSSFLLNSGGQSLGRNSCGRLYYKDRVRMKDAASGAVASFNTSFTFSFKGLNLIHKDGGADGFSHADGMTFTFGRNNDNMVGDVGAVLCLVKVASNGHPSIPFFAVEFDTFRNPEMGDPSNNHIGVDVNSVNSKALYNLCGGTVDNCTYLVNGRPFTAWIDYDSPSQKLAVYFAKGSLKKYIPKPPKPVIKTTQSFAEIFDDYMYPGFTGSVYRDEVHEIQTWQFATSGIPPEVVAMTNSDTSFTRGKKAGVIAGVGAGVGAVLLLAGIIIAKRWRRASHTKQGTNFNLMDQNLVPRVFTYEELSKATKNFTGSEMLGSGGFGAVYKGVLPSGALVAVKRMRHQNKHGEEGFQAEAASLSQIRHRNLVQLLGWCHEDEQLMLVYDFMCNGGLDEWLFHFPERNAKAGSSHLRLAESLPLMLRHSILSGVAAALAYLHEDCKQCVLHRDIKSSNVLLDEDLNAHLGDFGLARLIDHQKMEKTTAMAGTLGYMAPEMPFTWKATKESDVYSFGVLMLEVMCGMRPLDASAIERGDGTLVERVWHAHETGNITLLVDPKLGTLPPSDVDPDGGIEMQESSGLLLSQDMVDLHPYTRHTSNVAMEDQKLVTNLLHLGLLCCHPNPENRPSMRLVSHWLQGSDSMEMSLPSLPTRRPQAWYSGPGFSQMAMIRSVTTSLTSDNVQDAGERSFPSTLPISDAPARKHASIQASIATVSSSHLDYSGG